MKIKSVYIKNKIKRFIKRLGYVLMPVEHILLHQPHLKYDQVRLLRLLQIDNPVIFDVGAHSGDSVIEYNKLLENNCTIFSFEPTPDLFESLNKLTFRHNNLRAFNIALSNFKGNHEFHINKFSGTNSLKKTDSSSIITWGADYVTTQQTILVECTTLDDFIKKQKINKIDLLKIDVQGSELMLLEGAKEALKNNVIKIIVLEILTMPTYEGQANTDELLRILREFNYKIYNFYSGTNEHLDYITPNGQLRQFDAIYINSDVQRAIL